MCSSIDALSRWMASNRLLLNASTTQFIWLGGRRQLAKVDLRMLADTFPHVAFSTTVRDLGLTLDQELSFFEHVILAWAETWRRVWGGDKRLSRTKFSNDLF